MAPMCRTCPAAWPLGIRWRKTYVLHLEGLFQNSESIPTPMSQEFEVEVEGHAA